MSFPGFALGAEQAEGLRRDRSAKEDEQRQAQLANIANAGLSPEAAQEAIATLYKKDPSALKQHIQNLVGRLRGQQPQPTPMAYPNSDIPPGPAPAPGQPVQVGNPPAATQAQRRGQILSGGTTPQQRALELADERQRAPAPRNQTPTDVLGALMAEDVGKGIDPATDPRVQQVAAIVKEQQRQPAPKQKKAPKIITGTGGEPIGVTAEDEDGNQKNYYEKDMKDAPEDVSTLFKADQSAFGDKEQKDAQKQAATFSREVALLGARVSDSISIADYRSAKKAIDDAQKKATDAGVQSSIMEKAAPAAKQQDGAAMYTVLANFVKSAVGGTGMRVTQTEWNQAQQTRPWLQGVKAQFGPDGYLTGVKLAPEQIDSMVREGRQKSQAMNEAVDTVKEQHADDLQEGDELRGGNSKGKGPAPKKAVKKGVVSLAKARTLSQYKGKSDAEIKAAAEARGYEVKQ